MSMIVNMAENTQRDSDNEQNNDGDEMNSLDKYSNKGPSREESPEHHEAPAKPKVKFELTNFDGRNALLHNLFAQEDFEECKILIEEMIDKYSERCEYAFYVRGVIARQEGDLPEAIRCFTKAMEISNDSIHRTELGRVYFLQGNHGQAVQILEKAVKDDPKNSKAYYWLARSIYHLKTDLFNPVEKARDLLLEAPVLTQNIDLVVFLAQLQAELGDVTTAIQAYSRALQLEPENLDIMCKLGMLYLSGGKEDPSFAMFGKALSYDPTHAESILAAGAIMQMHGDHDVALNKYRVAADLCDYNGCLWNNIAMCLFSKGKLAAAHSCLKKASFICPLDYKINYNLGIVHQAMGLNVSALHFLKAAAELKKDDPQILGAMAVVLSNMNDVKNARRAYQKAMKLDAKPQTVLNYAIFEFRNNDRETSRTVLQHFKTLATGAGYREDLVTQGERLEDMLLSPPTETPQEPVNDPEAEQ